MRLRRLQLRGLKGLSTFTRPIDLDLAALPDGLIAVTGANGAGKSTFLEAPFATLHRQFPSRPDCQLPDAVEGRDAYLDVELDVDGRGRYHARVSIDAVSRAVDGILELTRQGHQTERLNDGKISTFKTAVARELPSSALVLASTFAAQNRQGSFSTLDRKGRRELFAELLGLEDHERRAQAARTIAAGIDRRLAELRALVAHLIPSTTPEEAVSLNVEGNRFQIAQGRLERDRQMTDDHVTALAAILDEQRVRAATYMGAHQAHEAGVARRAELVSEQRRIGLDRQALIDDEARERREIQERRDRTITSEQAALVVLATDESIAAELTREIDRIDRELAAAVKDKTDRIANNEALLGRATAIRDAVAEHAAFLEQARAIETQITSAAEHANTLACGLGVLRLDAARIESAPADLAAARLATGLLDRVPCGGRPPYDGCELLKSAQDMQAKLHRLEARVQERADLLAAIADCERVVADQDASVQRLKEEHRVAMTEADRLKSTVAELPRLEAAEERVKELRADILALDAGAVGQRTSATEAAARTRDAVRLHRSQREQAIRDAHQYHAAALEILIERVATSSRKLDERATAQSQAVAVLDGDLENFVRLMQEHAAAAAALTKTEADLAIARDEQRRQAVEMARLEADIQNFRERRHAFSERVAERERLEAAVTTLNTHLIEWSALAKIFGRDGLPVLEIDAAGPGVSALANDLLQACFGARFTVELITQQAKVDGSGLKEVFELRVYDADRGGDAKDLGLYSGGEQVILDEAVKSAIALYINQRNVLPLRTCWRDETTGALDPENALRYVQMLRRVQARGGFSQIYFITHNPDAAALADVQLVLGDGRIDVRYPPFAATEVA